MHSAVRCFGQKVKKEDCKRNSGIYELGEVVVCIQVTFNYKLLTKVGDPTFLCRSTVCLRWACWETGCPVPWSLSMLQMSYWIRSRKLMKFIYTYIIYSFSSWLKCSTSDPLYHNDVMLIAWITLNVTLLSATVLICQHLYSLLHKLYEQFPRLDGG